MDTAGDGLRPDPRRRSTPPSKTFGGPAGALALARLANDEMAELVCDIPNRFIAAAASIPMNDVDAAVAELDRDVDSSRFAASRSIRTSVACRWTIPRFAPLFDALAALDFPSCSIRFAAPTGRTTRPRLETF